MKKNVGVKDRMIRFAIAFVTITLYLADCINGLLAVLLLLVLMMTALFKFCPIYSLFQVNTLGKKKHH